MTGVDVKRIIKARVPVLQWLARYNAENALGDLVAGFTVGLTLIPQAIAYAALAGLEPQYGLYSALAGSFVYIVFGTCREVSVGPTALVSLLTWTYAKGIPEHAALLCFLSGCITMLLGALRLGFLVEFVSVPVVSGFTSAASVIIACSQIKGLLGLHIHGESFVEIWRELANDVTHTKTPDLILSCSCISILLVLKRLKDRNVSNGVLKKFLWTVGTARNALVVILCALGCYIIERLKDGRVPFTLTDHIDAGLPSIQPPPFSRTIGNVTESFVDIADSLKSGILVVPFVSIIGNVAIAKAFSRGIPLDATQEMLALGLCNAIGSFFQSMPVTGSFSRSAVNDTSGVRTPLGGVYTGFIVILALSLFTPYFSYIPKATLSSVIISAVIFMVDVGMLHPIWKCNKRDLIPALVTFFACLFAGVELGLVIGSTVHLAILIYLNARPAINIQYKSTRTASYVLVRPSAGLLFPSADYLTRYLTESLSDDKRDNSSKNVMGTSVVLDCLHIDKIDFTVAQAIATVIKDLHENHRRPFIMLRAIPCVIKAVQSLSDKRIVTARNELELETILNELTGSTGFDRNETDEHVVTKL